MLAWNSEIHEEVDQKPEHNLEWPNNALVTVQSFLGLMMSCPKYCAALKVSRQVIVMQTTTIIVIYMGSSLITFFGKLRTCMQSDWSATIVVDAQVGNTEFSRFWCSTYSQATPRINFNQIHSSNKNRNFVWNESVEADLILVFSMNMNHESMAYQSMVI